VYCIIVAVIRRPALAAGHTSIVKFQGLVKIIKRPILMFGRNFFHHILCPLAALTLQNDGKLGYGFTSTDELEEVDIGPWDKPRPTFIRKS
jgi:hypothetical protein